MDGPNQVTTTSFTMVVVIGRSEEPVRQNVNAETLLCTPLELMEE